MGNCGPESARLLVHGLTDSKVDEYDLYDWAKRNNAVDQTSEYRNDCNDDPSKCGGTHTVQVLEILHGNGVPGAKEISTDRVDLHESAEQIMQRGINEAAGAGRPVIVPVYGDYTSPAGAHNRRPGTTGRRLLALSSTAMATSLPTTW